MCSVAPSKKLIFHEALLNHFKENKVEIANAITKPFPFLESLRDRSFITETIYNECQEACKNLVPVGRVVYHVLCQLEKTFDRSLLHTLFSCAHLKEYPDLVHIYRSFENVIQGKSTSWKRDQEKTYKMPSIQPSCEQVPSKPKALGIKKEKESEELPSLLLNGQGIISESRAEEEAPQEAQSPAPGRGPGEEDEDGRPGTCLDETDPSHES